jgi:hypothetical protein
MHNTLEVNSCNILVWHGYSIITTIKGQRSMTIQKGVHNEAMEMIP